MELNLTILGLPRISPIQTGSTEAYLLGYLSFWQGEENLTDRLQPSKKLAPNYAIYHVANELDSTAFFNSACDKDALGWSCNLHFILGEGCVGSGM